MAKRKRVAINGFGRMGRLITRHLLGFPDIELVAITQRLIKRHQQALKNLAQR